MRNSIFVSVAAVAVAAANPVMMTFINEFGFEGDSLGWVELHCEPTGDGVDMTGWLLMTSTSVCTFACTMPSGGFLVVDSASLAGGQYGHGTFRLNPAGDHVWVVPDSTMHREFADTVEFPVLPARRGRAPAPPFGGSAAVCNEPGARDQTINWYIDSTPTREMDNDDYSSVSGLVTWAPERNFYQVDVVLSGPMGVSFSGVATSGQSYQAIGLGAGRYAATACGWPGGVLVWYPESVDVGYSQVVTGINIDFDPPGIEEGPKPQAPSRKLAATVIRSLPAGAVAFDAMGRRVMDPKPGVYFLRRTSGVRRDALGVTKVVVQR